MRNAVKDVDKILRCCDWTRPNPYSEVDMEMLAALDAASVDNPWDAAKHKKALTKAHTECFALMNNGAYVGAVVLRLGHLHASLVDIFVHKKYRRRGIGTALLRSIDSRVLNHARRVLEIVVSERNLEIQNFLKYNKIRAVEVVRGEKTDYYVFRAEIGFSKDGVKEADSTCS